MINVIQVGIGPLGQKVVKYALERKGINIVGAVDLDPKKIGADLGDLCGESPIGVTVEKTLDRALEDTHAEVAIVTTLSSLEKVAPLIEELAVNGLNIVSTCEELSYPWEKQSEIAERIDRVCKQNDVSCLGTGVNPGFLMDYLPSVLSSVCQKVDKIKVTRVQDASARRIPFQKKIGSGLNSEQFEEKKRKVSFVMLVWWNRYR